MPDTSPAPTAPSQDPAPLERIRAETPWADAVGYCRALRVGDRILVSGTAPVEPDGSTHAPGDPYRQTRRCLEIIQAAVRKLGGPDAQVIRTRLYVTDAGTWEAVGEAHGESFSTAPPVTTLVEVSALISPDMMVEVEAEAWIPPSP